MNDRLRTVDPRVFTDPALGFLTAFELHVAIALVVRVADDDGRFHYQPALLRPAIWPEWRKNRPSAAKLEKALQALRNARVIQTWKDRESNRPVAGICGWKDGQSWAYQRIRAPGRSLIGPPPQSLLGDFPQRERGRGAHPIENAKKQGRSKGKNPATKRPRRA